ncbi:MAG: hypothetical protein AAGA58_14355 [Verrucomicrobiota bacterium]
MRFYRLMSGPEKGRKTDRPRTPDRRLDRASDFEHVGLRSPLPKRSLGDLPALERNRRPNPSTPPAQGELAAANPDVSSRLRELFASISEPPQVDEPPTATLPRTVRPVRDSNNLRDIAGVRSPGARTHYDRPPPVSKISSRLDPPGEVPQEVSNPRSKSAVIGALAVIFLGGILTFGAFALSQSPQSQEAPTASSEVEKSNKIASLSQSGTLDSEAIARQFVEASTIEEKAALTRFPQSSLDKIETFYGTATDISEEILEMHSAGIGHNGDAAFFLHIAKLGSGKLHLVAVLESERGGLAVDWDSFARENPVSWTDLVIGKSNDAVPMRVTLEKSDYFNYDFNDAGTWSSFRVKDAEIDEPVYVYAAKGSLVDEQIQAELSSKKLRQFILNLKPSENAAETLQLEITGLEQVGWVR